MSNPRYSIIAQRLMVTAASIIDHIDALWEVYRELFEDVDKNNPEDLEVIQSVILELEHNLTDIQDQIRGQAFRITGVFEPIPVDEVEDFESSVLTTLAGLDKVSLDDYRVERFTHE